MTTPAEENPPEAYVIPPLQAEPPPVPTAEWPRGEPLVSGDEWLEARAAEAGITVSDLISTNDLVLCVEIHDCDGWLLRASPHAKPPYTDPATPPPV